MFDTQLDRLRDSPLQVLAQSTLLRPYQIDAVAQCLGALAGGHHPVLSLATGAGKSLVIAALCHQLQGRILVATHRQELLEQNSAQLTSYIGGDSDYGIYSSGLQRREDEARIIFGGIQSIYTRMTALQEAGAFAYVIVDECHRVPPPSIASMYGTVFRACRAAQRIGLTATPYRLESGLLHGGQDTWFDTMPVQYGIRALTPDWLAPLVGVLTAHDIDVSQVRTRAGEFVSSDLSQAACEDTVVKGAVEELCALAQHRQKWLVFCVDVAHTRLVTLALQAYGIHTNYVIGDTASDTRREVIHSFRDGTLRALVNCEVFTTGFDVPDVDCIVLLRPTQSKALVVQMLGRGTRKACGKTDCLVLDFAGNIERHTPLDELTQLTKSAARVEVDEARERAAAAQRERKTAHEMTAGLADPMAERPDKTLKTYHVQRVSYCVRQAKKYPGRSMLLVSYYCPQRLGQHTITTFLCLEHSGWVREQAAGWFLRRDKPVPQTAKEAMQVVWRYDTPTHIVVREDTKFPRVLVEQFGTRNEYHYSEEP